MIIFSLKISIIWHLFNANIIVIIILKIDYKWRGHHCNKNVIANNILNKNVDSHTKNVR